jgi:hypothetical protein
VVLDCCSSLLDGSRSEVLGARDRGGQDAEVCTLFASLLIDLVGYHDAYAFRFFSDRSGAFYLKCFSISLTRRSAVGVFQVSWGMGPCFKISPSATISKPEIF